jgi:hypothetical protein
LTLRRGSRLFAWTVLAAVLCTAVAVVETSFVHTDDGCAVEVHCLACRWSYSTTIVFAPAPPSPTPASTFEFVPRGSAEATLERPRTSSPSRGPPLS